MGKEISLVAIHETAPAMMPQPGTESMRLAETLSYEGAKHAVEAGKHQKYAEMARELVRDTKDANRRELARIAVWHFERCAAGFRLAVVSVESAARIQKDETQRVKLLKKAETMTESALRAELAALELKESEKKMRGGLNNETG